MTVHLCCFHFLRQSKKIEDVGEENEETTSVIISNEEQINSFDKSPTRQSQQNLVKKKTENPEATVIAPHANFLTFPADF